MSRASRSLSSVKRQVAMDRGPNRPGPPGSRAPYRGGPPFDRGPPPPFDNRDRGMERSMERGIDRGMDRGGSSGPGYYAGPSAGGPPGRSYMQSRPPAQFDRRPPPQNFHRRSRSPSPYRGQAGPNRIDERNSRGPAFERRGPPVHYRDSMRGAGSPSNSNYPSNRPTSSYRPYRSRSRSRSPLRSANDRRANDDGGHYAHSHSGSRSRSHSPLDEGELAPEDAAASTPTEASAPTSTPSIATSASLTSPPAVPSTPQAAPQVPITAAASLAAALGGAPLALSAPTAPRASISAGSPSGAPGAGSGLSALALIRAAARAKAAAAAGLPIPEEPVPQPSPAQAPSVPDQTDAVPSLSVNPEAAAPAPAEPAQPDVPLPSKQELLRRIERLEADMAKTEQAVLRAKRLPVISAVAPAAPASPTDSSLPIPASSGSQMEVDTSAQLNATGPSSPAPAGSVGEGIDAALRYVSTLPSLPARILDENRRRAAVSHSREIETRARLIATIDRLPTSLSASCDSVGRGPSSSALPWAKCAVGGGDASSIGDATDSTPLYQSLSDYPLFAHTVTLHLRRSGEIVYRTLLKRRSEYLAHVRALHRRRTALFERWSRHQERVQARDKFQQRQLSTMQQAQRGRNSASSGWSASSPRAGGRLPSPTSAGSPQLHSAGAVLPAPVSGPLGGAPFALEHGIGSVGTQIGNTTVPQGSPTLIGVRRGSGANLGISDELYTYLFGALTPAMDEEERRRFRFVLNACPVPDMRLDKHDRRFERFNNTNGLVEDPMEEERARRDQNPWTEEEKEIFCDKFVRFPKRFNKIAQFLPNKSVNECVSYYYTSKMTVPYKKLVRQFANRRKTLGDNATLTGLPRTNAAAGGAKPKTPRIFPPGSRELMRLGIDLSNFIEPSSSTPATTPAPVTAAPAKSPALPSLPPAAPLARAKSGPAVVNAAVAKSVIDNKARTAAATAARKRMTSTPTAAAQTKIPTSYASAHAAALAPAAVSARSDSGGAAQPARPSLKTESLVSTKHEAVDVADASMPEATHDSIDEAEQPAQKRPRRDIAGSPGADATAASLGFSPSISLRAADVSVPWSLEESEMLVTALSKSIFNPHILSQIVGTKRPDQCLHFLVAQRQQLVQIPFLQSSAVETALNFAAASMQAQFAGAGSDAAIKSEAHAGEARANGSAEIVDDGDAEPSERAPAASQAVRRPLPSSAVPKWTTEERQTFLQHFKVFGRNWPAIAPYLPCRSEAQIKNFYQNNKVKMNLVELDPNNAAAAAAPNDSASPDA